MYADQVEGRSNRSVKERLDRDSTSRRRPISGKRQRESDDKWEHDLFEGSAHRSSKTRVGEDDLRVRLQRKSCTREMSEKISDILSSGFNDSAAHPLRKKPTPEVSKRPKKNVIAETPAQEAKKMAISTETPPQQTKKVAIPVAKKPPQQTVESVDDLLKALDLEKYSITFEAEEVDMKALVHLSDEDLKTMGIPMGPRKKILLALQSRV